MKKLLFILLTFCTSHIVKGQPCSAIITPSGSIAICQGNNVLLSANKGDNWSRKVDLGGPARSRAIGFSIGNKGYFGTGATGNYFNDFWEFDPTSNTSTQKADFGGTARYQACSFSIGSKGYIGTGWEDSLRSDFWEYNPANNTWTQKANFGGTARAAATSFSIGNKGYIGAGDDFITGFYNKDFWEYDPATNAWTKKADIGGTGRKFASGFSIGNKGYIGTGINRSSLVGTVYAKDFWEYDPTTNTWTQKADFGGVGRFQASGFSLGNKGYIGTGRDAFNYYKDFWEFDPTLNTWIRKADFGGTARYSSNGFSIGNKGYIGGAGADSVTFFTKDIWEYTPPLTYLWSTGATTPTITISSGGNYTVTVTNTATGCSSTSAATLITIKYPTTSDTSITACGSYTWNGVTYTTSGTYTKTGLINAVGCDSVATLHLTIKSILSNFTSKNANCFGSATGSISVFPSTGVAPFTYRLGTVGSYVSSNTFINLKAGKYTISIQDAIGCSGITQQITIGQKPAITGTYTKTDVNCFGTATGIITVNGNNGIPPYTYRYGTTGTFTINNNFTNLEAGSYRIYIKDSEGCIGNFPVILSQPPALSFTYSKTDANCFGTSTGSITIAAIGGKTPYQYRLGLTGTYVSSNSFTGLAAGSYVVFVKDSNNCTFNTNITVGQPTAVSATISKTDVSCFGLSNGSFTVTGTGGMPPYTHKLGNAGTYSTINSFTKLKAGVYQAYIKDVAGCIGVVSVTIVEPAKLGENLTLVHPSCYGASNGSIVVNGSGGTPPYQYKFTTSGTYASVNSFTGLKAGSYRVYVQDAKGCSFNNSVILNQQIAVSATFTKTEESCPNAKDGSMTITGAGGKAPYTYRLGTTGAYTSTNTFTGLKAGSYRVYVNDANGCTGYSITVIIVQVSTTCFTNPVIAKTNESVIENNKVMKVTLSPNPSNGTFTLIIHSDNKQPLQLRIINETGKLVHTAKGSANQTYRFGENLSTGVYMIEVRQGDEVRMVKGVKIK